MDNITISSIGSGGICSGINVAGSVVSSPDSVQITNCTIDGDTYGINVNNSCTDIDIINNEISSCDSTGINISNNCESITIEDNSIGSCAVAGILVESSCDNGSIHGNTISLGTCTYGIKINSSCDTWYITNNDIDITDGTYGIYLDTISNPYIVNNMIDGNYSSAIVYDKDSANFTMNYNTLRNQTEYVNMKGYHGYRTVSDLTYLVASFHNNIISLPTTNYGYAMYIEGNSSYWIPDSYSDISNNLYYNGAYCGFTDNFARSTLSNWQSALGDDYDDNSLRVDPKLTSASDMHLQSTSPCFGTGAPISSITTDFDGNDRNSTNPNIGADEFDSITVGNGEEITISWDQVKIDAIIDAGGIINLIGPASGIDINFSTLTVNGDLVVDGTVLVKADTFNVGSTGEVQVGDLETD